MLNVHKMFIKMLKLKNKIFFEKNIHFMNSYYNKYK